MDDDRAFLEIELEWVKTLRKGNRIELIGPALRREQEIYAALAQLDNLVAANFSERDETPEIN